MAVLLAVLLALPKSAAAHGAVPGVGAFYGGLLHPLVVPAHLIALLAAAILSGQRGWDFTVATLPVAIAASVPGLALSNPAAASVAQPLLLGSAVLVGVLVATAARLPIDLSTAVVGLICFVVALDSPAASADAGGRLAALAGTGIAIAVLFAWVAAPVTRLTARWSRVALQVTGSWLAASALLALTLALSGRMA